MLVVSEASGHGLQIFDLTKLRDIQPNQMPALFGANDYIHYAQFGNAHNVIVNEDSGFAPL